MALGFLTITRQRGEEQVGTKYLRRLQFETNSPVVEGQWTVPGTAQDQYTECVGLHGTSPSVVIQLIEETDGRRRARKTWTAQGEVEGPAS
ncbi:hypothetical protein B7755_017065 [Streptomyces sp. NBS 14/10]|uniref:hypothetical protein n=1 Tax=Streptomyces sp. NBS 14/10 TaxID=1945643 RepID=UPI0015C5D2F8|nr:hypothetical protein [Streptomyces sp. NBS 14/10]KAK1179705.1 hypothetical protein B7755_017065 [Streptomyces sp. NBS 14/10]